MSKDYGFEISIAGTQDSDGKSEMGVTVKDSEGINIDRHAKGDDLTSLTKTLVDGISKEVVDQKLKLAKAEDAAAQEKAKKEKEARDKKRAELQKQVDDLRAQINALDKVEARTNHVRSNPLKDDYDDLFRQLINFAKFF